MDNTQNDNLMVKLAQQVEHLIETVKELTVKVESIKDVHIVSTTTQIAVLNEKVNRLEMIVYGVMGLAVTEGIALIISFLKH